MASTKTLSLALNLWVSSLFGRREILRDRPYWIFGTNSLTFTDVQLNALAASQIFTSKQILVVVTNGQFTYNIIQTSPAQTFTGIMDKLLVLTGPIGSFQLTNNINAPTTPLGFKIAIL